MAKEIVLKMMSDIIKEGKKIEKDSNLNLNKNTKVSKSTLNTVDRDANFK
ncbi:hypothetical protein [Fusobacterium nucleatum]